jgi:hypothetical protein
MISSADCTYQEPHKPQLENSQKEKKSLLITIDFLVHLSACPSASTALYVTEHHAFQFRQRKIPEQASLVGWKGIVMGLPFS